MEGIYRMRFCRLRLGPRSATSMLCYSVLLPPSTAGAAPLADHRPGHDRMSMTTLRSPRSFVKHSSRKLAYRYPKPNLSCLNEPTGATLSMHPIPVAILAGYATVESDGKQVAGVKRLRG